jgi:hypothetical protein
VKDMVASSRSIPKQYTPDDCSGCFHFRDADQD